jgi:type IV secretory pathway VirB10-like protein
MPMGTATTKICSGCGIDVAQQKRVKDERGRYYCHLCWSQHTISDQNTVDPAPPAETSSDGLSLGEKRLIAGGILIAIIVAASLVYMLFVRTWWEDHHRDQLLSLQRDAQTLARTGRLSDAKQQYDQMFVLVGAHQIRSDDLRQSISSAHDEANKVVAELAAQEQARLDEERRQQIAKAEHDRQLQLKAAQEQAVAKQKIADAQTTAAAHQKAAEEQEQAQQAATQQRDAENARNQQIQEQANADAEAERLREQQERLLKSPLGVASIACQQLVNNGTIISATFNGTYSWGLGLKSGRHPPASAQRVMVNFDFNFQTQGGLNRTYTGYVVVDRNGDQWSVTAANIDGEEREFR